MQSQHLRTIQEAADALGLSPATIRECRIRCVRDEDVVGIPISEIHRIVECSLPTLSVAMATKKNELIPIVVSQPSASQLRYDFGSDGRISVTCPACGAT